ncbi:4Fe-4S binding protein [Eubacterium aggregans]|uniref:4Fe-4S binding protein n=1 Tax=Eubacterium aggregans TaxID=81409 RepID=UPI003F2C4EC8
MGSIFHSVYLDRDKCLGCTTCLRSCPTGEIRVREGKAKIIESKCIDCGECIRVCPHRAKSANTDPLPVSMNLIIALPSLHRH